MVASILKKMSMLMLRPPVADIADAVDWYSGTSPDRGCCYPQARAIEDSRTPSLAPLDKKRDAWDDQRVPCVHGFTNQGP